MDEDTLADLKQFIVATISQQTADIRSDIKELDKKLSGKIDTLSDSVADALESSNQATDAQLNNHEKRIGRLEHKIA